MSALTSTHPLSPNVAAEYGAACAQDEHGVWHIGNGVTQQDFDEALADLIAINATPMTKGRNEAYERIQSEGYGR
jgi:hypothetical protein